jgi:hypothetical protein
MLAGARAQAAVRPGGLQSLPCRAPRPRLEQARPRTLRPCAATEGEQPAGAAAPRPRRAPRRPRRAPPLRRAPPPPPSAAPPPRPPAPRPALPAAPRDDDGATVARGSGPGGAPLDLKMDFEPLAAGGAEEPTAVQKFLFPEKEELPDDFEVRGREARPGRGRMAAGRTPAAGRRAAGRRQGALSARRGAARGAAPRARGPHTTPHRAAPRRAAPPPAAPHQMPIWDHLEELRERVLIAGLAALVAVLGCFCYSKVRAPGVRQEGGARAQAAGTGAPLPRRAAARPRAAGASRPGGCPLARGWAQPPVRPLTPSAPPRFKPPFSNAGAGAVPGGARGGRRRALPAAQPGGVFLHDLQGQGRGRGWGRG